MAQCREPKASPKCVCVCVGAGGVGRKNNNYLKFGPATHSFSCWVLSAPQFPPLLFEPPGPSLLLAGSSAPQLPASYSNSFLGCCFLLVLSPHYLKGSFIRKTKSIPKKKTPSYRKASYLTTPLPAGVQILKSHEHHLKAHALCKACWEISGILYGFVTK